MKNFSAFLSILSVCFMFNTVVAQDADLETDIEQLIAPNVIKQLRSVDTIPEYHSKENKLKLTGTIYQSDGVTPAKDVILFIEQPDEDGNFDLRKSGDERYVFHRSWVKTDANGQYTLYTFVPGGDRRYNQPQQIFPSIKAPATPKYMEDTLLFDNDPLLTQSCRKRMKKNGDTSRILKPQTEDGLLVAEYDIILKSDTMAMR
ncbi:peptidase associated/transthyretin-like domain-containing protein [Winogradskyella arenosi]|uniref:Protocatechuate 3,4-dioxygenase beta subunit n=1 Tax=Winogradskyella arenosi TaxID=533325 RepID=A0A368ZFQ3_9FLAO|nr:hypothetical protein [Winogradskyella arenosi]RCW90638.1 protocatechuate 3,4-dioxygenase beta subunit [Winogradskyella arenosi]